MWGFCFTENCLFIFNKKGSVIYLNKINDIQKVLFPKGREFISQDIALKISNTIYETEFPVNIARNSNFFCEILIRLPRDIQIGEYEYALYDLMGLISSGVVSIADEWRQKEHKEFHSDTERKENDIAWQCNEYGLSFNFEETKVDRPSLELEIIYELREFVSYPYVDIKDEVIWLNPDDFSAIVNVKSNVSWIIE